MTVREERLHAIEGRHALVGDQGVAESSPGVMPTAGDGGHVLCQILAAKKPETRLSDQLLVRVRDREHVNTERASGVKFCTRDQAVHDRRVGEQYPSPG